jgi:hypothetical protein
MSQEDRTASLMTPAKLAQLKPRPAASPAAWLDQMASDAGHMHVARLTELAARLQDQARERSGQALDAAVGALAAALDQLRFDLAQPQGLLARVTGKGRSAGAQFAAQQEAAAAAARNLAAHVKALSVQQAAQEGLGERTLVELEVEFRAIDKIIDQGARWLQAMRNQLRTRQAQPQDANAEQAAREDTARCELLVVRLKLLRAASSAAQAVHEAARDAAARRQALLRMLQHAAAADLATWQSRTGELAGAAAEGRPADKALEAAAAAHRELQLLMRQVQADAQQSRIQEDRLAQALAELSIRLEAA